MSSSFSGVIGRLAAALFAASRIAVEGLMSDDERLTLFGACGSFSEFGGEGDDHSSKVAATNHAKEDVRTVRCGREWYTI